MSKQISYPSHLTGITHKTFRDAYNAAQPIVTESHAMGSMNISGIITRIIQDTARFCESHNSDVLLTIDDLRLLCDNEYPLEQDIDEIFVMGIRQGGVDGNSFTISRLKDTAKPQWAFDTRLSTYLLYPNQVYRRILAVRITASHTDDDGNTVSTPHITCELRNITNELRHIAEEDIEAGDNIKYLFK